MLPFPAMKSIEAVRGLLPSRPTSTRSGSAEHGIGLYYHNHHIEFAKFDGKYMLDIIAENSPAMGLEIDVHWVQRGGLDPVRTLQKYAGRTAMVHLKDYRIGQLPESAFGLLESGDIAGFMAEFKDVVQFAEVGEGNLDFPAIISPPRPPAPSTCSWSRTSCTGAPSGKRCRPPTTTWWPWATPTFSRLHTTTREHHP